ncbi:Uncharacterized protein DBV15_07392 [Temnothorax longispinosus]|uniref:Uncharacterized protein n=1 Tax=Temnothorax longispinosus TaxID=300112 RepID=A0A4V3SC51_9HYME|nr:Uncharacterized protein DBV15_07392 [Temnothorax longispinosus]
MGHRRRVAGSSPERKREDHGCTDICDDESKPACALFVRSLVRSFALSRNSSVLCLRLCMHNELQSRNSLLKPSSFTTVENNQLTIAYVGRAVRMAPVSPILIAVRCRNCQC